MPYAGRVEDDPAFLTILTRHLSEFEEARYVYGENTDMGICLLESLLDDLDLSESHQEYAEAYVCGDYDPF